jgi:hypothetical protein
MRADDTATWHAAGHVLYQDVPLTHILQSQYLAPKAARRFQIHAWPPTIQPGSPVT